MLLIYGECQKNQRQAAILYAEHFPNKRHSGHRFFHSLFIRLVQYRTLHVLIRSRHVPQRAEATINAIREVVIANPHTSTRSIGYNLQLDQSSQNKKNLNWHPFKRHTTQKFFPQDLPRREAFCDWLSEQVRIRYISN